MILYSVLSLFGLGLSAAIVLAIASRVFYVEEDPRIEAIIDALPGANCGGCGYAGCEGYAIAVANNPKIAANLCCAGSSETSIVVGELTGKSVPAAAPQISFRRCEKIIGEVARRFEYQGMPSCAAATLLINGIDACSWSCLGYGDCIVVCPFEAMTQENRMVKINTHLCTGCGLCISICPRDSLTLVPAQARVGIHCATHDKLRAVMDICKIGCINCGKCIKSCPAKAITSVYDRIEINHKLCLSYGPDCAEACTDACHRNVLRLECDNSIVMHASLKKAEEDCGEDVPKKDAAESKENVNAQI